MSGIVRVRCEECGDANLKVEQIHVRECLNTGAAEYVFRCPYCDHINIRQIRPEIKDSLFAHPLIRVERWSLPAEVFEPHEHPPLTVDDVLDFKRELESL